MSNPSIEQPLTGRTLQATSHESECEAIRSIERTRLTALVEGNIKDARPIHASEFQLITPIGMTLSKDQYLGAISAGVLKYHAWDPKHIDVRLNGPVAVIRYQSSMEGTFGPHYIPRTEYWHTDIYESSEDTWQIVWSQATEIRPVD